MVRLRGRSPSLYREDGVYYLIYEKHNPDLPELKKRRGGTAKKISRSRFEISASSDLMTFEEPRILLDSADVPLAGEGSWQPRTDRRSSRRAVSPLPWGPPPLFDSRQKCSPYFAMASSRHSTGLHEEGRPLLETNADDQWHNMAVGSVRVLRMTDGYVALQCAYGWDTRQGKSISTLVQLESSDGIEWRQTLRKPVLTLPKEGWASSYIVSCDVNYKESEACWYCYYSANRRWGRTVAAESIGLLLGKEPSLRRLKL